MPFLTKPAEACIFCEQFPCDCSPKKKTKKAPAVAQSGKVKQSVEGSADPSKTESQLVERPADSSGPSMRDKMKAAAERGSVIQVGKPGEPTTPQSPSIDVPEPPSPPTDDEVLLTAIRNAADLLHPVELQRYRVVVSASTTTTARAAFWRAGREVPNASG